MANELHIDKLLISEQPQSGFAFPALTRDPVTGLVCVGPPVLSGLLAEGMVLVGNQSGAASPVPISGAITITYAGVTSITDGYIQDVHIAGNASISRSKISSGSSNRIVINDSDGLLVEADAINPDLLLVSNADGIPTHSAFGVDVFDNITSLTSPAQAQLDVRLVVNLTSPDQGHVLYHNGTDWVNLAPSAGVLTSDGTNVSWAASTANGLPGAGDANQILRKIDGTPYNAEWHTLVVADVTDLSVTEAELNLLSGLTVDSSIINFLDGTTGLVQEQINDRQLRSLPPGAMWVGGSGGTAQVFAAGSDNQILTTISGYPVWQNPPAPGTFSGPVSSTDNALVRFDGTTGASGQNSVAILTDTGDLSGIANLTVNTTGAIRTSTSAGNTLLIQAYDVDGTAYVTFATLTANDTPTMDLNTNVTIGTSYIYRVGGTDVGIGDGGTGSSLSDPGADRIMFWDGSAGAVTWLEVGSGLSITDTTITASTGVSGLTANRIPYATSETSLTDDSALTWDETNDALTIGTSRFFTRNKTIDDLYIGEGAGNHTSTGSGANTGIGRNTLIALTTGNTNTVLGNVAGAEITSGNGNTIIGHGAGDDLTTGTSNTMLGGGAKGVTTGSQNLIIGAGAEVPTNTASGQLSIQNIIYGESNTEVGVSISTGNIGIGIKSSMGGRLHVRGLNNGVALLVDDDAGNDILSVGESGGARVIGFFGVTPAIRQVVATGSSTDDVITALQNLGLLSQT